MLLSTLGIYLQFKEGKRCNRMFNIAINNNKDYSYIEVFINYLRELIAIIKELFSSIGSNTEDTTVATEATTV